jgi:serine-type D-Ala-D-Ala carboxypeptidase/endopeptidase
MHLINSGFPLGKRKERSYIAVSAQLLAAYAGTFAGSPAAGITLSVDVRARGSRLFVQAAGEYDAFAETDTRFFVPDADAEITFEKDAAGKANSLVVHREDERDWRAQRVQ